MNSICAELSMINEHGNVLNRLRTMKERTKPRPMAGMFLVRMRERVNAKQAWMKAKFHWFEFCSILPKIANIAMRRHKEAEVARRYMRTNYMDNIAKHFEEGFQDQVEQDFMDSATSYVNMGAQAASA